MHIDRRFLWEWGPASGSIACSDLCYEHLDRASRSLKTCLQEMVSREHLNKWKAQSLSDFFFSVLRCHSLSEDELNKGRHCDHPLNWNAEGCDQPGSASAMKAHNWFDKTLKSLEGDFDVQECRFITDLLYACPSKNGRDTLLLNTNVYHPNVQFASRKDFWICQQPPLGPHGIEAQCDSQYTHPQTQDTTRYEMDCLKSGWREKITQECNEDASSSCADTSWKGEQTYDAYLKSFESVKLHSPDGSLPVDSEKYGWQAGVVIGIAVSAVTLIALKYLHTLYFQNKK